MQRQEAALGEARERSISPVYFPAYFTTYTSGERVNMNLQRFTKSATLPYLLGSILYGYNNEFTAIYANPIIRSPSSPPGFSLVSLQKRGFLLLSDP